LAEDEQDEGRVDEVISSVHGSNATETPLPCHRRTS
jgi:hypothetical protein